MVYEEYTAEGLQKTATWALPNLASSEMGVLITAVLLILLVLAFGGAFFFLDWRKTLTKTFGLKRHITVIYKRGSSCVTRAYKGDFYNDKQGKKVFMLSDGTIILPPHADAIQPDGSVIFYSPEKDVYFPILLSPESFREAERLLPDGSKETIKFADFKPMITDIDRFVFANAMRNTFQTFYKPSAAQQFMPLLIILATGLAVAVILWLSIGQFAPYYQAFSNVATQCGNVASNYGIAKPPI